MVVVMSSSLDKQIVPVSAVGAGTVVDTRGKHRILVELKRLEQELRFLQEELREVEKMGSILTVCKELVPFMETKPDPPLPVLSGVINPLWDRWFERTQTSPGCRCCIL